MHILWGSLTALAAKPFPYQPRINPNSQQKDTLKTLKHLTLSALCLALFVGCGNSDPSSAGPPSATPPSIDIHEAAIQGNVAAIKEYIAAGSDLNAPDPTGGSSPLILTALFGQPEAAKVLIEAGADLNRKNTDGTTALINAAFFCRTNIVKLLLTHGADRDLRNKAGSTALDSVAGSFDDVKPVYDFLGTALGPLGLDLDYEQIKTDRPKVAALLSQNVDD
jgi:uncharacterized protein